MLEQLCAETEITRQNNNSLVVDHLYIAEIIAKKFANKGVEYDDLYQIASLALVKASARYDASKGIKFSSFATPTLIGEVKNYFRDKSRMIKLPRSKSDKLRVLNEVKTQFYNETGRAPTANEIAERMNISEEEVIEILEANRAINLVSIDNQQGESDFTLLHALEDEDKNYQMIENRDFIKSSLKKFSGREREFIYRRYIKEESQRTIANAMGVSQMYISRLEKRVLEEFKRYI